MRRTRSKEANSPDSFFSRSSEGSYRSNSGRNIMAKQAFKDSDVNRTPSMEEVEDDGM